MKDKILHILLPSSDSRWIFVTLTLFVCCSQSSTVTNERKWEVEDPILLPGIEGAFDELAVKDPSVVFFDERWHLFYTARSKDEYTTGYVSARDLDSLQAVPRYELENIRGKERYGCAPQILYFEPQEKWYLIFQTRDANYQPAYSTNASISNPDSWTDPLPLIRKDHREKWIDFWIICDEINAYLFYTQAHAQVMVRTTSIDQFPSGWGQSKVVLDGVHEAVHVYKVKGEEAYHMIYELNHAGFRSFGLASAGNLKGPWEKIFDNYATGHQLTYHGGQNPWTEMVSHGEAIRTGCDQRLEYDPQDGRWLVQGILEKELKDPYYLLPWKLGVMEFTNSGDTMFKK
jgi:hypothetical protein